MVYQIQYNGQTIFDIEYYLTSNKPEGDAPKQYFVELNCQEIISAVVDLIHDNMGMWGDTEFTDFKNDCDEIGELHTWLWETYNNSLRSKEDAQKDYDDWLIILKDKIKKFANKYGCSVNID